MAVNEREVVLNMLLSLDKGGLSHKILKDTLYGYLYLEKSSRGFITGLYKGAIEKKIYLDFIINKFSKTPTKKMKPIIRLLLEIAVYQMFFMRVPDSAAINESVKLSKKRGFKGLSGFVNGVLRNIARNKEDVSLPTDKLKYMEIRYSTPYNIIKRFVRDYGIDKTEKILMAFEEERPITIRVNSLKTTKEALIRSLKRDGVEISTDTIFENSIKILKFDNLNFLESFSNGEFIIQDESSAFMAEIADEGVIVLDLCAAPGGKSFLFAEKDCVKEIVACDITEKKVSLIEENISRLGTSKIKAVINDATVFNKEFENFADIVICDLPCSGLGVIGRKSDIKYKVTEEKIKELSSLQKKILLIAQKYVKTGGILIFSTCTMTKEENEENFKFISEFADFLPVDFSCKLSGNIKKEVLSRLNEESKKGFIRLIPGEIDTDGFFISEFRKVNTNGKMIQVSKA